MILDKVVAVVSLKRLLVYHPENTAWYLSTYPPAAMINWDSPTSKFRSSGDGWFPDKGVKSVDVISGISGFV